MKNIMKKYLPIIIAAAILIIASFILRPFTVSTEPKNENILSTQQDTPHDDTIFTICYDLGHGFLPDDAPMTYTEKDGNIILPTPIRAGYTFLGWYKTERREGEPVTNIEADSTGNRTVYADWRVNVLTVNYYSNVSKANNELVHTQAYRYEKPSNYSLTDYTGEHQKIFIENPDKEATGYWGTEPDGGILISQDEQFAGWELGNKLGIAEAFAESDQEINLYAQWRAK